MTYLKSTALAAVITAAGVLPSHAITLNFDDTTSVSSNTQHTGASASIDFDFSAGVGVYLLDITIANTTGSSVFGAGATEAQLTGFGFDLLASSSVAGSSTGTFLDTFLEDADFQPFDTLDVAFADNGNFNGGNAQGALPEGQSDMVQLTISDASFASFGDFQSAYETGLLDGSIQVGLRFQSVNAGAGSDKLQYGDTPPPPIPLPAAGFLLLSGLGLMGMTRRFRKA